MKKIITSLVLFSILLSSNSAQMWNGLDTLYGNEWIQYDQNYFKIQVSEDGIYRLPYQEMIDQGIPVADFLGNQVQLFYMGQEIPIHVSSDEGLEAGDFIEFYGKKNRSELDRFLFENPDVEMANPEYSLFSDTSAYFLTWNDTSTPNRIDEIDNDLNNAPLTPEAFCLATNSIVYNNIWTKDIHNDFVFHSRFEKGEGFVGEFKKEQTVTITPTNLFGTGPESQLSLRYVTGFYNINKNISMGPHEQTVTVNGSVIANDEVYGIHTIQHDVNLPSSSLPSLVTIDLQGNYDSKDHSAIASVKLIYPRSFDFAASNTFHFKMPASSTTRFLKITNFTANGVDPVLYDLTNNRRIEGNNDGVSINIALPPSNIESELVLVSSASGIKSPSQIRSINFIDYSQEDAEYIIISNKKLYDDGQGNNWVEEFSNYRSSAAGRNFNTIIVDVEQLYDQFSYGINRHSISIRNFGHFIFKNWTDPKYVFLLGKGREYQDIRTTENLNTAYVDNTFHIPTLGAFGGGDNLLFSKNNTYAPIISVGRLPAKTGTEIKNYLDKVIEHEEVQNLPQTIEDKLWIKNVIHLGGGAANEQLSIQGYLNGFKSIIENNKFGGNVTSFFKTSADPIYNSQSDALKNLINNGAAMLTFFGHSSVGSFDYSVDNADAYENKGKYPVMFSFGCYSGKIHTPAVGISEDFVLAAEKGAIAFFATTGIGYSNRLNIYGREFFSKLGGANYGEGLGDLNRISIKNTENSLGFLGGQMTLNGDPAIRLFLGEGPDYIIDRETVKFDPNPISIQRDSFDLTFDIANIGFHVNDSMVIEIKQKFPNGTDAISILIDSIPVPEFKSTLNYKIPVFGIDALGPNEFYIEIDKNNAIAEFPSSEAENNNTLKTGGGSESITVYFISKEIVPVFPNEFGIVSNQDLTLKASTSSTFIENQKYVFQIDTTEAFNSPLFQETEIEQLGGVLKWKPNMNYLNNTVYYWRVSPEEDPAIGGFVWRNSSFVYLEGSSSGWNQSHKYQYQKDILSNLLIDGSGKIKYVSDFKDLAVESLVLDSIVNPNSVFMRVLLNNDRIGRYVGPPYSDPAGIQVTVFDSIKVEYRINSNPDYYWGESMFPFKTDNLTNREELINYLNNEIEDGEYVLLLTNQTETVSYEPEEWASDSGPLGTNIFDVLEAQGATQIRDLETEGALPYIFLYQKGIGAMAESMATSLDDLLFFNHSLPGSWDSGEMTSTKIGPAKSWESLLWQTTSIDNLPTDEFSIDLYGIKQDGTDSLVMPNIQDYDVSLSSLDADEFPYIQLKFNSRDSLNKTSVHLDHWRVLYQGMPEVALNPASLFTFHSDTLDQGEPLSLKIAIENIGEYDMDSLLMKFAIIDQNNNQDTILKRLSPILIGDTLVANLKLDTRNFGEKNTLFIEANPNKDQNEQFHFNNLGFFNFYVKQDVRNPIMDVTFDGIHIMDGDLVSSKPRILITLKDENSFLLLEDTTSFQVLLRSPGSSDLTPVFVDGDQLAFYPATQGDNNKARLEFNPLLLSDGTYQLVVLAEDVSGNQSGDLAYKVSFEIVNKSSISKILNYPNPFSTSTKFVFTITGDEIPDNMKIQIMTVSGRIIREIRMEELGPIHVGNNMTPFSWDGTDEYGAKLANGVYLYRVVATKANGEPFDLFQTRADSFFKNGIGKMVIIR
ncbi:MAG: C25 family cysteine peptidase [Saprospiraceae bacterium]|nr:C25 family cysteine peptidase [Saprospiraceae bacterium]